MRFADRSEPRSPSHDRLWHLLIMLGCAFIAPLVLFGVYTGFASLTPAPRVAELMIGQDFVRRCDRQSSARIERLQALAARVAAPRRLCRVQRQAEASLAAAERGTSCSSIVTAAARHTRALRQTLAKGGVRTCREDFATGKPQVTGLFMAPSSTVLFGITVRLEIGGESRYVLGR